MPRVFFIADTHFGDTAILAYENRPFASVQEMDEALIANWNDAVSAEDTVFLLGDFSRYASETNKAICARLHGHKLLVLGNHDTDGEQTYLDCGFESVSRYPIIYDGFWMLSHAPLYLNANMPYANLFGHVHQNPIYTDCSKQSFCVSAERIAYTPIALDQIKRRMGLTL